MPESLGLRVISVEWSRSAVCCCCCCCCCFVVVVGGLCLPVSLFVAQSVCKWVEHATNTPDASLSLSLSLSPPPPPLSLSLFLVIILEVIECPLSSFFVCVCVLWLYVLSPVLLDSRSQGPSIKIHGLWSKPSLQSRQVDVEFVSQGNVPRPHPCIMASILGGGVGCAWGKGSERASWPIVSYDTSVFRNSAQR